MENTSKKNESPVYFWRETETETGWLSQWYYCPFKDGENPDIVYDTAEHYMMYQKALLFLDKDIAKQILTTDHPRKVKTLGRKVKNFSDDTWNKHRKDIVRQGNILKFTTAVTEEGFRMGTNTKAPLLRGSLREMLLETGNRELIEASPFDRVWGIGFKAADAKANKAKWGLNLLGMALMDVRQMLRDKEGSQK